MATITNTTSLERQIAYLTQQQEAQKKGIEVEFSQIMENLKPVNLIKNLFHSVKKSPDLKADLLHGVMGIGTGFLTNKFLLGKMEGPIKKILGALVQFGITNAAVKYPETIKNTGISLLTKILKSIKLKSDSDSEKEHMGRSAVL